MINNQLVTKILGMMKTCNLVTIAELYQNSQELFDNYIRYLGTSVKTQDVSSIVSLLDILPQEYKTVKSEIFDDFYIGYKLPQLNKEFDLLKIISDCVLNIELKTEEHIEDVKKQILRHKYYLCLLKRKICIFTFIEQTKTIYKLSDNDIVETDIYDLLKVVESLNNPIDKNIDFLFNPASYLISPFNKTDDFVNNNYVFTDRQEQIEKEIISSINNGESNFLITGSAGTGKTLLTYHFAKTLVLANKKVTIIHCGMLNAGHYRLISEFKWIIIPIKDWMKISEDTDVIVIDEIQRISLFQFNSIKEKYSKSVYIFCGDKKQTLNDEEIFFDKLEENIIDVKKFKLSTKIRTNEAAASFIRALFDKNQQINNSIDISRKISVKHFFKFEDAFSYILLKKDYQFITYTPSRYNSSKADLYQIGNCLNAHRVIGQEFENVLVLLDINFYYENNKLRARKIPGVPYPPTRMLFQQVSRTINSLEFVVLDNPKLFSEILEIFN
ncbi:RNA helicase [Succinivibrio dextrinosolvens DSM 3072]|uniref:RNA helicase n=1 Tax=Succinivibrio dextrinosolvens DSM 3072 TaxID=1123324 RepID=A0A1T4VBU1_9GAMM|nr:ATP-binding protein [Succinivibrio dextrinosolvens]SKA62416.1 RNA helicase [Succinivibrio dextrinosolvens DSM 3072]